MSQAGGTQRRTISIQDFWQLAIQAQLMSPQHCQALQQQFSQIKGAMNGNGATLAEWLISQRQISRFHAKVLLSGQPGPFMFGDYRVYDRIESGRLAGMFRAVHNQTNHPVLLQFLSGPSAQDPQRLALAAKRASISNSIHHPHVARCYHFCDQQAYKFLVVEDLHGKSLDELLAEKGPLPPSEACRVVRQAALGLMRLEELKIVHGEMRPSNLWVNQLNTVKVMEFPLWRDPLSDPVPFDASAASDPKSTMAMAADYLAPELARGGVLPDARSDIYSLGCILYQVLTGQVPFPESNAFRKVLRHTTEQVEPPDRVNPNVPGAVSQLVLYMMAKDPNQRYQQAAHVAEALVPYIDPNGLTTFAESPTATGQAYEGWVRQSHPGIQPDPDTGEFNFTVNAGDAGRFQPVAGGSGAPLFGGGAFPDVTGMQALANSGAADGAAPVPTFNADPAAGTAAPAGGATLRTEMTDAERERLEEERFAKKMTNYAMTIGGTVVIGLVILIVAINLSGPVETPVAEGEGNDTQVANVEGAPPKKKKNDEIINLDDLNLSKNRPVRNPPKGTVDKSGPSKGGTNTAPKEQVITYNSVWDEMFDDRGPQWSSPTSGPPVDLKYLASGCQFIIVLRPADMLAQPEMKKVLEEKTLGPFINFAREHIESIAGIPFEQMEQVIIGLMDNSGSVPKVAMVVRATSPVDEAALVRSWGGAQEQMQNGRKLLRGGKYIYHIPPGGDHRVFALAPTTTNSDEMELISQDLAGEHRPLLRTEIEGLVQHSDVQRHVTIFFAPNFLFAGGKEIFNNAARVLKDPIDEFLLVDFTNNEYAKACSLSMHVSDEYFFTELRVNGGNAKAPAALGRELYGKLVEFPKRVYHHYEPISAGAPRMIPSAYSRDVLARYPMMLSAMAGYLRSGMDQREVVFTTALPPNAAHNLALGTQLALLDKGTPYTPTGANAPTAADDKPKDIYAALARKVKDFDIPSDNFDRIIPLVIEELNYKQDGEVYTITFSPDLEEKGITKNKRFGVKEKNASVSDILMAICRSANPTGGVKDMASDEMDLVWVIAPSQKEIIWTIRPKAKTRGTAPPAFGIK